MKKEKKLQVKVKDWNINYEVLGEGKPVVLLHGWLTDLETMRPIANNLKDRFKVYLIDVVGFGKSEPKVEGNSRASQETNRRVVIKAM